MRYDYLYSKSEQEYVSARIYPEKHLDLCVLHAREMDGKVRCRKTGKIIFDFCKSKKRIKC